MAKRTLKDWLIATRPWSFPASAIPVIAISAYMFWLHTTNPDYAFDWVNALLALPMMILFQAAGNLISDYYDHIKGVDLPDSLNGVRHIQSGKFSPIGSYQYGLTLLACAAGFGALILWRAGFEVAWIGVLGILFTLCYPWLKYHALGDVDILVCYALLPSLGVSYITSGVYLWDVLWLCLPFGLITVGILHANNTRDIRNDRRAGIITIPKLIGGRASQRIYAIEMLTPFILTGVYVITQQWPYTALLTLLVIPKAWKLSVIMLKAEKEAELPIANLDQQTAQTQLMFGLLLTIGFIIDTLL